MASYGYVLDNIEMLAGEKIAYYIIESPVNVSRAAAWRAREALLDRKGRAVPSYRIVPESDVATART
jgi:hypothetical protein